VALGIDIGGSGIKGALVDTATGRLVTERVRVATPEEGTPEAVLDVVVDVAGRVGAHDASTVGVTFPGVVVGGTVRTAVNLDDRWVGTDLAALVQERLGCPARAMNDADAAGYAECVVGAAREERGTVVLLTIGTGVGSAVLVDRTLVPNVELGHLQTDAKEARGQISSSVREDEGLSWEDWAKRVNAFLRELEKILTPSVFVLGGGVAASADDYRHLLDARVPVRIAELGNAAGIVGAALLAHAERRGH
jgi:polyphosphate glucokinase